MMFKRALEPNLPLQTFAEMVKAVIFAPYPQITYDRELSVTAEAVTA